MLHYQFRRSPDTNIIINLKANAQAENQPAQLKNWKDAKRLSRVMLM
jgi:hypothetical protein